MLKTRLLNDTDYDILVEWWKGWPSWKNAVPPKDMLPQNGQGGVMVYKDDTNICAGFLYTTNSKIAWLEFIISNPQYRGEHRKEAIKTTIDTLCYMAKELGFGAVFTSVKHPSLIKYFKDYGFTIDSHSSYEMTLRLQ